MCILSSNRLRELGKKIFMFYSNISALKNKNKEILQSVAFLPNNNILSTSCLFKTMFFSYPAKLIKYTVACLQFRLSSFLQTVYIIKQTNAELSFKLAVWCRLNIEFYIRFCNVIHMNHGTYKQMDVTCLSPRSCEDLCEFPTTVLFQILNNYSYRDYLFIDTNAMFTSITEQLGSVTTYPGITNWKPGVANCFLQYFRCV